MCVCILSVCVECVSVCLYFECVCVESVCVVFECVSLCCMCERGRYTFFHALGFLVLTCEDVRET